jgi:hypothetical protein
MTQERSQAPEVPQYHPLAWPAPIGAAAAVCGLLLAGCGGGGGGAANSDGTLSSYNGFGPGNPTGCPRAAVADIWFNNRVNCLVAGQKFLSSTTQAATGAKADVAYIFNQQVTDSQLNNVLPAAKRRYFKYALCLKNAPASILSVAVAGDLGTAIGLTVLATGSTYYPSGVAGSIMDVGGTADSKLQTPCDPAKHPVIVNFDSGLVESVNLGAVSGLTVFDQ